MNSNVKSFIEENIDLINNNMFKDVFYRAGRILTNREIRILSEIFNDINIDTTSVRWEVVSDGVKQYITDNLNAPRFARDRSNSWARLDYMIEELYQVGFTEQQVKDFILQNESKLGLKLRKLSPEYGWLGDGDYAFQWFDETAFDKEYNYAQ